MLPTGQGEDRVWVALDGTTALLRVVGRGSFKIGTALKQFGQAAVDGGCRLIVLDMSACVGMDSTFMGVLAGLAGGIKKAAGPDAEMVLLHLSARTRGLVATLGLDQIVVACEEGDVPERFRTADARTREMVSLEGGQEGKQTTAETMLEAHEELIQLDPSNLPRFKDVLTFLREDLNRGADPSAT